MAETNGAECHRAVGVVRAGGNFLIILIGHNEVELTLLHLAAGQNLGGFGDNLDIIARRCRVGVYKLCAANGFAVQFINGVVCHKLTFAVIGDFESDLVFTGIIPDAAELVIHLTDDIGLLAYGFREFQGKRNVAVCVVEGGIRNRVACLFAQCEREIVRFQCAVADHDIQYLGGVQSYRNFVGVIDVGEFCDIIGLGLNYFALWELAIVVALIILSFAFQHAVVVRDSYHNFIAGFVVGDARNTAAVLGNEVSVFTCGIEFQLLIAADGGGHVQLVDSSGGYVRQGGIAITAQGKVEGIRAVPWAAIQLFLDLEQFFGFRRVRLCLVGVYKLGSVVFGIAVFNIRDFQVVGVIQRNRDGGGDILGGLGHAGNISVTFRNGVGVSTRLFVGDYTEIGGLIDIVSCYFDCFVSGHRGTVRCRKGKGERVTLFPVTADNALAYAQLGCGFALKGVGEDQLAAVYGFPLSGFFIPLKVGSRDAQGIRFRTLARNHSLNQVLLCAVINIILLIRRIFGKQVIIGPTTVLVGQRVGDICKGNCAIRIVDGACLARHGDVGVVMQLCAVFVFRCGFEFEVEPAVGQIHRSGILTLVLVDFLGLNIERLGLLLKGVGKLDTLRIFLYCAISEYMLNNRGFHFQLAVDVRNGNRHTVEGAVIRNTFNFIDVGGDILGDVVHILAGFGEGDTLVELKGNLISVVGVALSIPHVCRYIFHTFFQRGTIDSHQFEIEMIVLVPIAARQNLYAAKRVIAVIRFHGNRGGVIGVCHRDFFGCTCRDRACAVVRNVTGIAGRRGFFRDGIDAARGQTHNLGSLAVFQGEFSAALDGLGFISADNGILVLGIGVQALARQRKVHRKFGFKVRVQTLVGFHLLSNLQAACGVHGQLTVVAKVQHTLVCVKIPLEVNAADGGLCRVFFLIAQLAINGGGQAAFFGARLDVVVTIRILSYALLDGTFLINVHGNHIFLNKRFITFVRVLMQVV